MNFSLEVLNDFLFLVHLGVSLTNSFFCGDDINTSSLNFLRKNREDLMLRNFKWVLIGICFFFMM